MPPSLDELVPENHFVRIVSKTVDELRIEEVFAKNTKGGLASRYHPVMLSTVKLLNKKGYVTLEKYFVDGTKIESAANKYTFVWKKFIEKNEKKLDEKLKVFLREVEEITYKENEVYGDKDLAKLGEDITVTSEEIKEAAAKINEKLAEINHLDDEQSKDVKKAQRQIEKNFLPRKEKYEKANATFEGRNSYSKTDEEATFMRMKEGAMLNGQVKLDITFK